MTTINVIIVNWNTRDLLFKCIDSIYKDPAGRQSVVWIVDNASTDGSIEHVRSSFPEARLIQSSENLGYARANNIAIQRSRGDKLLLLNPDTQIIAGAIGKLADYLDENPTAGAVGPRLLNPDGSLQRSTRPAPTLVNEFAHLFHLERAIPSARYPIEEWDRGLDYKIDVLLGACMMIRREALNEVGLLDERYFMYSEEVDLCLQLRKVGWTIHWLSDAEVVHFGGQSSRQVPMESFLALYGAKIAYFRKHYGAAGATAYKLILTTASMTRLFLTPLALLEPADPRKRHVTLAKQYHRLLLEMPGM